MESAWPYKVRTLEEELFNYRVNFLSRNTQGSSREPNDGSAKGWTGDEKETIISRQSFLSSRILGSGYKSVLKLSCDMACVRLPMLGVLMFSWKSAIA